MLFGCRICEGMDGWVCMYWIRLGEKCIVDVGKEESDLGYFLVGA